MSANTFLPCAAAALTMMSASVMSEPSVISYSTLNANASLVHINNNALRSICADGDGCSLKLMVFDTATKQLIGTHPNNILLNLSPIADDKEPWQIATSYVSATIHDADDISASSVTQIITGINGDREDPSDWHSTHKTIKFVGDIAATGKYCWFQDGTLDEPDTTLEYILKAWSTSADVNSYFCVVKFTD